MMDRRNAASIQGVERHAIGSRCVRTRETLRVGTGNGIDMYQGKARNFLPERNFLLNASHRRQAINRVTVILKINWACLAPTFRTAPLHGGKWRRHSHQFAARHYRLRGLFSRSGP
jgi:hypothetical protein